jgi:hypothetical protein
MTVLDLQAQLINELFGSDSLCQSDDLQSGPEGPLLYLRAQQAVIRAVEAADKQRAIDIKEYGLDVGQVRKTLLLAGGQRSQRLRIAANDVH